MEHKNGKQKKREKGKEITRREFLMKSGVIAGGTLAGTAIFGNGPYVFTPAYAAVEIRTIGIPVSIMPDVQMKATKDLKMKIIGQAMSSEAMVQKQRTQPDQYEVSEGYFYDLDIVWQGYQPIDTKRIKYWDKLNPLVTEGYLDP